LFQIIPEKKIIEKIYLKETQFRYIGEGEGVFKDGFITLDRVFRNS
jgi:hypothetical protein